MRNVSKPAGKRRALSDKISAITSLVDLRVREVEAKLLYPGAIPPLLPEISVEPQGGQVQRSTGANTKTRFAVYDYIYSFTALDERETKVVEIKIAMNLVFRVDRVAALSEEELQAFGSIGGIEIAHPYVRELVHNLTLRMGLPPFVLEVNAPIVDEVISAGLDRPGT